MTITEASHADPVWRGRANFIVGAAIDPTNTDVTTEQLWARRVGERLFEICCIPFFAYNLALGDIVETDSQYTVERVQSRSGRAVFRVAALGEAAILTDVVPEIVRLGGLVERSSLRMIAVDAASPDVAREVANLLARYEAAGLLEYETGEI